MISYKNKICIISPLGYTGIAYYDHSLCQSLSEIGVDVVLITSKRRIIAAQNVSYTIKKFFVNTYGDISRIKKGIAYLLCIIRTFIFIVWNKYKIAHFQIVDLPAIDCFIFLLLKMFSVKIIFTPHDIYSLKNKMNNAFLQLMYQLCTIIIVHNEANKYLLVKQCRIQENKIRIIAHGNYNYFLNPTIQKSDARDKINLPKDKTIILFFGNIRPGKGIETLLTAFKTFRDKMNVLLLIAGKISRGYTLDQIKSEIDKVDATNNVILRNYFIENSLIECYYKASDIVVVPYEYGYESGVLRYAFSCGVPTIISNLKEFSQFAADGENCLIFRVKDADHLAEKINFILDNPPIAQKIAYNAKKLSDSEWAWIHSAHQTKKVYEQLLQS